MRVLLQDGISGKFFAAPDEWTAETERALGFQNGADVIRLAKKNKVASGRLYYCFSDRKLNFSIPIDSSC